ncbi:MAG: hypothetical protein NCW75_08270 [Phycisphaera sp.]|nr:MAG: hypothetical protein NCW75_08270 [Phycisphaera sp.]
MLLTRSRSLFAPLAALALASIAGQALAVPLAPGGSVSLSGDFSPGTVVRDTLVPFTIIDRFGLTRTGFVQDRVVRRADGTLAFQPRIRDVGGSSGAGIIRVVREGMAGFFTDVDYDPSGVGTAAPTNCLRSGDGDNLDYSFAFAPVFGGQSSKHFFAKTDADQFTTTGGRMTLILEDGRSTTIVVAAPVIDTTPPNVSITSPSPESCVCPGMVDIRGLACDPESDLVYTVRARRSGDAGGTGWMFIGGSSSERCSASSLTTWNTTGLPGGDYIILVEAINQVGLTASAAIEVRLDTAANPAVIRTPETDTIIGGTICLDGSVGGSCFTSYTVDYRPTTGGPFLPVDGTTPVYTRSVTNDPFANWDTRTVADGKYEVRVRVSDVCGRAANTTNIYEVDNTAPIAEITSVLPCEWVNGLVDVKGEVFDTNIASWVLEYTGGSSRGWTHIASGTGNIPAGDTIAIWDTTKIDRCAYTLRLRAGDKARVGCVAPSGNAASDMVSVNAGCEADLDGNGVLDIFDFLAFSNLFGAGCP